MSIDVAPASAVYVLPQTVSPLSAVELALAAGTGTGQPSGTALSKVVSRLQEAHRQATQPQEPRPQYVQVQEIHLMPSMHDDLPTVVASANRVDVYV